MVNRIVGIIGWIGTALVFGAVAARFFKPEWNQYASYAAQGGLACVLIYMAGQWRDVAKFYEGRGARLGTMSIVSIVAFLGILVAVNYLGVRQSKRWDLTANQFYSLSDQTVKILKGLDSPLKFTVYDQELSFDRSRTRLNEYKYHSSRIETEYVDVDKNPTRAKAAGIQQYGTIVIDYKGRTEKVTSLNEQDLTNGLIKAATGKQRKVYFTRGHGEKDSASTDRLGYGTVTQGLTSDNYGVETMALVQQKEIPADATVVIIAGPQTDFLPEEIAQLKTYVARGGKVLIMLDPSEKPQASTPLLIDFLHDWGVNVGNDFLVDMSGTSNNPSVVVAIQYPTHAITEGFNGLITAFPASRSMTAVEGGVNGHNPMPIVESSPGSWAEQDIAGLAKAMPTLDAAKGDRQGPVSIGLAVSAPATDVPPAPATNTSPATTEEPQKPESRIVAIGDSDFPANAYLGIPGNRDFFINTVNWLAQQEGMISIRPKSPEDRRLTLPASAMNSVMLLSIFIIPGLVFASGVYAWWRRR